MANVLFKRGTFEQYNSLVQAGTVDSNAIYFITDRQEIYVGDKLYAEGRDLFVTKAGESEVTGTINALSGIVKVATPSDGQDQYAANKLYVDEAITTVLQSLTDAMIFKGTIGEGGTPGTLPAEYKAGYSYKVITAGTYAGNSCEVGDMLVAVSVSSPIADSDWIVIQSNIDGAVTAKFGSLDIGKIPVIAESNTLEAGIDPTTLAKSTDLTGLQASLTKDYKDADSSLRTDLEGKITAAQEAATAVWETLS